MHWTEYKTNTSLPPREQVRVALKSGAFKQTTGQLQRGDAFCCHGVASIIAEQNGIEALRCSLGNSGPLAGGHPARKVMDWLGLTDHEVDDRISWNDDLRDPFTVIAKGY